MRVLVTGADGFIGRALVAALRAGAEVIATDRGDGDIADPAHLDRLFAVPVDRVFHLAAVVSGAAEADFDAGRRVNLDATIGLVDRCRAQARRGGPLVRFVQTSSIAVFGTPLPARIDDRTAPAPSLSYGTHKRVAELLIDDATRRGELDGRALRLSGVVVRPALPNGALSAFNSDVIREPLAGRAYECPVGPEATVWLTSRRAAIANLLHLADLDGAAIGAQRAVTAPALAVSIAEIVAALGRVDPAAPARVRYRPQAAIEAQFGRWPRSSSFARAESLGLLGEASIDALIRDHTETVVPSEAKDLGTQRERDPSLRSG
ncbi:MAG: NAD-dependent epimerase/dehydratase family protein [Pseudomonadota bacterium]|nr:NAD-dependent epimerase/dehydratase family protein [Pseudomonadota bacterium]